MLHALKNDLTSCYCTFFYHPHLTPGTMSVQVHVCTREWCTTQETAGMTDATSAASVTTRWRACTLVLTGQSFRRLFAGVTSSSFSSSSRSMQPHFFFRLVCCLFWLWCPCVFMTLTLRPSDQIVCCLFWLWCPCVFMTLTLRPSDQIVCCSFWLWCPCVFMTLTLRPSDQIVCCLFWLWCPCVFMTLTLRPSDQIVCCLFWLWCPCVFMTLTLRPSVIDSWALDL